MQSMTGFGQGIIEENGYKFDCIIKSVNAKFLDIDVKAPKLILAKEDEIKKTISSFISRGTVTVFINITKNNTRLGRAVIDKELASNIYEEVEDLAKFLNIPSALSAKDLARFSGVLSLEEVEQDINEIYPSVMSSLNLALNEFVCSRKIEGENLKEDLKEKIDSLKAVLNIVKEKAPEVQKEYYQKLKERVKELLNSETIDETRLITEVAFFADKADINEEIVRLASHIAQFDELISQYTPVGKKLEFLSQEMTREINTMGSKANSIEITKCVLDAKNINESIKEQIRNVE